MRSRAGRVADMFSSALAEQIAGTLLSLGASELELISAEFKEAFSLFDKGTLSSAE